MSKENPTFEQYVERVASKTQGPEYIEVVDQQIVTSIQGALFKDPETSRILTEQPLNLRLQLKKVTVYFQGLKP